MNTVPKTALKQLKLFILLLLTQRMPAKHLANYFHLTLPASSNLIVE